MSGKLMLALQRAVSDQFTQTDWEELGYETGEHNYITGHPRLTRSLYFGDEDYGACVVSVRPPHLHLSSNSCCDARPLVWMESGDVEQAFAVGEADRGVAGEW